MWGHYRRDIPHPFIPALICCGLLAGPVQTVFAQSAVTIENNGDPNNRVDIAVFGDGYTAGEMVKYANDVQNVISGIFTREPFDEYRNYFNIHRVDVVSNESGADHPEFNPPLFKDTAFDAAYNCSGIQRLICVNTMEVMTVASNVLLPEQRDLLLVIVNDEEYGGSGGSVAVASTHPSVVDLILHEMGHSFGLLGDEYFGSPPPYCNLTSEPPLPNITMQSQRELIKWNHWIEPATPIPTLTWLPGIPGLYEGAQYCEQEKFRPTYNSKMRTLSAPFEQVNTEQLVKRIYNWVSPLDISNPSTTEVIVPFGLSQLFSITTPLPVSHTLDANWYIDGSLAGSDLDFILDSRMLSVGAYTLEVVVEDNTETVRNDPAEILSDRWIWDIVVEDQGHPGLTQLSPSSVTAGSQDFTLTVNGWNFIEDSVVRWNDVDHETTYMSNEQLTASIPSGDVTSGGTVLITVFNPDPVNLSSGSASFNILDFSISKNPSSISVTAGQTAQFTLTLSSLGGFDGSIALSCTGAPSASTCSVRPVNITLDGTHDAFVTVQVTTTARSTVPVVMSPGPHYPRLKFLASLMLILTVLVLSAVGVFVTPQSVWTRGAVKLTALVFVLSLAACGGGNNGVDNGGGNTQPRRGTPAGIYTLTVTATSESLSHNTNMTLTVN